MLMKKTTIIALTLCSILLFVPGILLPKMVFAQTPTALKVQPQTNSFKDDTTDVGDTFTISIIASDIPVDNPFYGWEFVLAWTPGLINCTTETINFGVWTGFLGPWVPTPIDNVKGEYHQSLTGKAPATAVSGTFWLANLTFTIVKAPAPGETLTSDLTLEIAPGYIAYCLLTMTGDEIPHEFIDGTYSFASSQAPTTFDLTISAGTGGTTNPAPGLYTHNQGTNVQVTAINNTGYNFDHWQLDGSNFGNTNPITVTMDANHALSAVFKLIPPPGGLHDIAITEIGTSKTMIPENYTQDIIIKVTVENLGTVSETFNVTFTVDSTKIGELADVSLDAEQSTQLNISWAVTGIPKGNYTITAFASPVTNETETANNTAQTWVFITIKGDLDGDKTVNGQDAVLIGMAFASKEGDLNWNPDADLNGDGYINIRDLIYLGANFGSSWA